MIKKEEVVGWRWSKKGKSCGTLLVFGRESVDETSVGGAVNQAERVLSTGDCLRSQIRGTSTERNKPSSSPSTV